MWMDVPVSVFFLLWGKGFKLVLAAAGVGVMKSACIGCVLPLSDVDGEL